MEQPSSNIFEGYRSVGFVSNSLPFIVRHAKRSEDTRIITVVGRTFHTYSINLSLIEVSLPHECDISFLTSDDKYIYSSAGRTIFCWGRGSKTLINRLDNGHQANVIFVAKLGNNQLVSIDEDNVLFHWNLKEKEILNIISIESDFEISAICHPKNYKDKLLLGSKQGTLRLLNIPNEEILFEFPGWGSKVTVLTQSPVEDVVAIGLADGHILIQNIRYNETIMKIYQEYGSVTTLSFRLDEAPFLVSGSEAGHLMIWNLERKRLSTQIRDAHIGAVSKCQFIRNMSHLVTSGSDNSIKIWALDMSDGGGNLLSQRSGHHKPPNFIRFYGQKGFNLLSGGSDSTIKMFHLYSERLNRNLGTARLNPKSKNKEHNKLPAIKCFASETTREKEWDNIVACHQGTSLVTTWNYDRCCIGEHIINQPSFDPHKVTAECVFVTSCGNFVVIGFSNGLIFKYNLQSGIFRQTYETNSLSDHRAHDGPVKSVAVDGLDLVLVSGGADAKLKLWNFKSGALLLTWDCPSPIILSELHRENNLIAVALENHQIEIRDLEARTLVRKFDAKSRILDLTFSPDSRWLIVSLEDCSIRTWDLSLGKMIDAFRLSSPCVSLDISSTGEFLATAHQDSLGINIWCNYTIYSASTSTHIDPDELPPLLDMPHVRCDELVIDDEGDTVHRGSIERVLSQHTNPATDEYVSPDQIGQEFITISGLPSSRWKNILNIQELREKQLIEDEESNRKMIKVPFFIPVKDGLKPKLDDDTVKEGQEKNNSTNSNTKVHQLNLLSDIGRCLTACAHRNDFGDFIDQFKELGPSSVDVEVRSLASDILGDNNAMLCFLDAIEWKLTQRTDYDLTCSWLALFLKAHSDLIQSDEELKSRCASLKPLVQSNWHRLRHQFDQVICILNFIRSAIL